MTFFWGTFFYIWCVTFWLLGIGFPTVLFHLFCLQARRLTFRHSIKLVEQRFLRLHLSYAFGQVFWADASYCNQDSGRSPALLWLLEPWHQSVATLWPGFLPKAVASQPQKPSTWRLLCLLGKIVFLHKYLFTYLVHIINNQESIWAPILIGNMVTKPEHILLSRYHEKTILWLLPIILEPRNLPIGELQQDYTRNKVS